MAALVQSLYFSGSRLSTGEPNDSGLLYAYIPGTVSPATIYADEDATIAITQPITLDSGGRIPYATYPDGVWITSPVRLVVQDVNGATVSDAPLWPADARDTALVNSGYSGATVQAALSALANSAGGTDGNYLAAPGATERPLQDKLREQGIAVEDYGAVGNGIAIDTTAIQQAINEAKTLGVPVLFRSASYKIDQALTLSSASGVAFIGLGSEATVITQTSTSANILTLTSCTSTTIQGLGFTAAATNSGSAISLSQCTTVTMRDVRVNASGGGTFLIPIVSGTGTATMHLDDVFLTAKSADATARALKLTSNSGVLITGGLYSGNAGAAIELAGSTSFVRVVAATFGNASANIGILWTTGMTGTDFTVIGCPTLRSSISAFTTPFDLSALSTNPRFRQWGNEVDGYTTNVASAGTATPDLSRGYDIRIRATSTGAAIVIAAPTPVPDTTMNGVTLLLDIFNNAGGALSHAYSMDAAYHLTTVPNQTDLNHNQYLLRWDANSSVWRQVALSVTT